MIMHPMLSTYYVCKIKSIHSFIDSITNRGKEFRETYSRLSELRSLIPSSVNVMALTATASDTLISEIIKDTGMVNPYIEVWSTNY